MKKDDKRRYLIEYEDKVMVKHVFNLTDDELNKQLEKLSSRKVRNFKLTPLT